MGMFDTILLEPPMTCPRCNAPMEIQTKLFDCLLRSYRIGDVVSSSPVLFGVLEEEAYCRTCHTAQREAVTKLYLVVWHSILAGVELSYEAAQTRLDAVDRLDLIRWLDEVQKREAAWRRKFRRLYADVRRWHEELERSDTESEIERTLDAFHRLPEEIRNADDPLGEILALHTDDSPDQELMF